jgi:hypothetical protein
MSPPKKIVAQKSKLKVVVILPNPKKGSAYVLLK